MEKRWSTGMLDDVIPNKQKVEQLMEKDSNQTAQL